MTPLLISFQQLQAQVGTTTYARGQDVLKQKKVLNCWVDEQDDGTVQINASTRGSNDEVYKQDIVVDNTGKKLSVRGFCSCPVDYNCKHVVAAVLKLARDADLAQALAPSSGRLRETLDQGRAFGLTLAAMGQGDSAGLPLPIAVVRYSLDLHREGDDDDPEHVVIVFGAGRMLVAKLPGSI